MRLDRFATGRHSLYGGDTEIAEQCQRETAWDRCRRHHQEVGHGAFLIECLTLGDTEALLFVYHDKL
jgi:hypothetical protein